MLYRNDVPAPQTAHDGLTVRPITECTRGDDTGGAAPGEAIQGKRPHRPGQKRYRGARKQELSPGMAPLLPSLIGCDLPVARQLVVGGFLGWRDIGVDRRL